MLAAIEIYNKPLFLYREEVFIILLTNSWELLLKAIVSKSKNSIYYKKKSGKPYRTLNWKDAFKIASKSGIWPTNIQITGIQENLKILTEYRNNIIHYINNKEELALVLFLLAQQSIINYQNLLESIFGQNLGEKVTWCLLPLGFQLPADPITYLKNLPSTQQDRNSATKNLLYSVLEAMSRLDHTSTESLISQFTIQLHSSKKDADLTCKIDNTSQNPDATIVKQKIDSNERYPWRQKEILEKIKHVGGTQLNQYVFGAISWHFGLWGNDKFCWRDQHTNERRWSILTEKFLQKLTSKDVQTAKKEYKNRVGKSIENPNNPKANEQVQFLLSS